MSGDEVGELGISYDLVGGVAQSLGRAVVDRGNATREQVEAYMLSTDYDEDELWSVLGPLIDRIEDAVLADEDGDEPDDEAGLVLQPPVFDVGREP